MWVTFLEGSSALNALSLNGKEVRYRFDDSKPFEMSEDCICTSMLQECLNVFSVKKNRRL